MMSRGSCCQKGGVAVNQRTRDLLALGLFVIILGNCIVGWIRGSIDLTPVTVSALAFLGVLTGARPWERKDPPRKHDDDEEDTR